MTNYGNVTDAGANKAAPQRDTIISGLAGLDQTVAKATRLVRNFETLLQYMHGSKLAGPDERPPDPPLSTSIRSRITDASATISGRLDEADRILDEINNIFGFDQ